MKSIFMTILLAFLMLICYGCNKIEQDFLEAIESCNWEEAQALLLQRPEMLSMRFNKTRGYTLLHVAVYEDNREMLEFLIKNGADINIGTEDINETPLHLAARQGRLKMAAILLGNGAAVDSRDDMLSTPLHNACLYSTREMAELLLSYGAEIDVRRDMGHTPLFYACTRLEENDEVLDLIRLLLENGADPNLNCLYDNPGTLPIHMTLAQEHFKKTQLLVDFGATLELKTDGAMRSFTVEEVQELYRQFEESQQKGN